MTDLYSTESQNSSEVIVVYAILDVHCIAVYGNTFLITSHSKVIRGQIPNDQQPDCYMQQFLIYTSHDQNDY